MPFFLPLQLILRLEALQRGSARNGLGCRAVRLKRGPPGLLWRRSSTARTVTRPGVVFRDALRADPALAQRYTTLKRLLATRYAGDREAYTAAKGNFIRAVLQQQR